MTQRPFAHLRPIAFLLLGWFVIGCSPVPMSQPRAAESTATQQAVATIALVEPPTTAPSAIPPTVTLPLTATPVSPQGIQVKISPIDGVEMVYVPAGTYRWGVQVAELTGFWIDRYEVTHERFKQFMENGGYTDPKYWTETSWKWRQSKDITQPLFWDDARYNAPDQPVVGVSWYEADAYARWAGKRLPTTSEWQATAQGTDNRVWPWGEAWDPRKANAMDGSRGAPEAVGSYPDGASPFGALDMAGNVWEFTADWYRLRPGVNDESYCVILSSSWDTGFDQDAFCTERRSRSLGRFSSGGFRTAESTKG